MTKYGQVLRSLAVLTFVLIAASVAQAQSRTWVSGVGDDLNPCSRTAPCKTYSKAHSVTSANGEISTLDPGGFGTVNITKSITIDGTHGQGFGSILNSLTSGVIVNDSASGTPNTIKVRLRSLSIQGVGNGTTGIRFLSGKMLEVEDCIIAGQRSGAGHGIDVALTAVAAGNQRVHVINTTISDCLGAGIRASNTAGGGGVNVTLDDVRIEECGTGMSAGSNSRWMVNDSRFYNNVGSGIEALAGNTGVDLDNVRAQGNGSGIATAAGTMRIANVRITNNTNGINFVGGTVQGYTLDNKIDGNTNDLAGGAIAPIAKKP